MSEAENKTLCALQEEGYIESNTEEFLKLIQQENIHSYGIDTDYDMIEYNKKQGLIVKQTDAITHLKNIPENSLDGVFMSHIIEHLKPGELTKILNLIYIQSHSLMYN